MADNQVDLTPLEDRPLVTFALFAYNQEKYIREAVEGAFAQTYEPLEIILSDDCSTDRTFEIMEGMAGEYRGPHTIKLNRNIVNAGISSHVRFVHEISLGEVVVHAAGDDISVKERVSTLIDVFLRQTTPPSMICSNAMQIDDSGKPIGTLLPNLNDEFLDLPKCALDGSFISGCTVAITRSLIERFQRPAPGIIAEDVLLMRRAYMTNGVFYSPQILVHYRIHVDSITNSGDSPASLVAYNLRMSKDRILRFQQFEKDDSQVGYFFDRNKFLRLIKYESLVVRLLTCGFFSSTGGLLSDVIKNKSMCLIPVYLARWIPFLYTNLKALKNFSWSPFCLEHSF